MTQGPRARTRGTIAGVIALAMVLAAVSAALAVGTDGVEMTVLGERDARGTPTVVLGGAEDGPDVEVRNLTDEPRRIRVYSASASITGGTPSVGGPGSASWAPLDEELELAPEERRRLTIRQGQGARPDDADYLAFVLEVRRSSSLVTQAVTIAGVDGPTGDAGNRLLMVLAAVLLGVTVGAIARFGQAGGGRARSLAEDQSSG